MGKRGDAKVLYHTALPVIFGVKKYADVLWEQVLYIFCMGFNSREGVIIEWPLNDLFHNRRDVIHTSRMVVI